MSDRYSGQGAGQRGSREYFTSGQGPGRGTDIAEKREPPKQHRRGVGNGDPIEIDLNNLSQPGIGPADYDEIVRGRIQSPLTTFEIGKKTGDID